MVFDKIKNAFSKKSEPSNNLENQVLFNLNLMKEGKIDKHYDDLIRKLLDTLKDNGLANEELVESVFNNRNKLIKTYREFTIFSTPEFYLKSDNLKLRYNLVKKDFQLFLSNNPKYKDYKLFGAIHYTLGDKEKRHPLDFIKIISGIYAELTGLEINVNQSVLSPEENEFTLKFLLKKIKEKGGDLYLNVDLSFYFTELNDEFYKKIRELNTFLTEKNFTFGPFDETDIKKRYEEAVENFREDLKKDMIRNNFIEAMSDKGVSKDKAMLMIEESHKLYNKLYLFSIGLKGIAIEDFLTAQNEFFENIDIQDFSMDYEAEITSFHVQSANYGCFIKFEPIEP